ncbi:hypothetical protein ACFYUY_31115 [Kitasatospora sp. NPDC004745]|uniref:hypothetical protein n=1 Tax=Kitasatospora sp. NPDC004745 TaxID=3364019 RepID=UPI0036A9BB1F
MPTPKIVIAPSPMPAPFQRADLQGPYDTALAAAALELLAANTRTFRPGTASIEFTTEVGGPRIQALWPEVCTVLVTPHRRELWRRRGANAYRSATTCGSRTWKVSCPMP